MSDETESTDLVGQPTGQHSLNMCGAGEGKAWRDDRARFPNPDREKNQRLEVPPLSNDHGTGYQLDYTTVQGPRGGSRRVLVAVTPLHQHSLSRHNLAKVYAEFAASCEDPEIARYAEVQAMAKTAQADGKGNKFAAYRDRPKPVRPARTEVVPVPFTPGHGKRCFCSKCRALREEATCEEAKQRGAQQQ